MFVGVHSTKGATRCDFCVTWRPASSANHTSAAATSTGSTTTTRGGRAITRPPGPRGHWLLGNPVEYDRDRIAFLRKYHREFGDVFSFSDTVVLNIDPRLSHEILTATNRAYVTELPPFAGSSALEHAAETVRPWMRARRAVRAALSDAAVAAADHRFVALLDTTLDRTGERDVAVLPLMLDLTAHAIAGFCLGADHTGVPGLLADNHTASAPFEDMDFQFPAWLPLPRHRRLARVHRRTRETLTAIVAGRRPADPPRDLLDVLLTADPPLSPHSVMTTVRGIMIGGHGVPAAALTSLVRELARRPGLADDLAAEAGDGEPAALLPLAEAVVKETLRLTPPVWLTTRVVREPATFGGWALRPGDEVLTTTYLIHRDPRWWSRPDEFDPARWHTERPPHGVFLPFGAGPRYCVGAALAMRWLTLAASRTAQRFRLHSPGAATAEPEFCGRLAPAGLRAAFRPRVP
jgi:unspecific monooxygenase